MAKKKNTVQYEIDDELRFGESHLTVGSVLRKTFEVMLLAFGVAVVLYAAFALLIDTDAEVRLRKENRMYAKLYPELLPQEELLGNAIGMLQSKDGAIYSDVFDAQAPKLDPMGVVSFAHGADSIPDEKLVFYTNSKSENLVRQAEIIETNLRMALSLAAEPSAVRPPMSIPLAGVSYTQVGASKGLKMDPLLNARVNHNGVDFIVPQGKTVCATAPGTVILASKSGKGQGNVVEVRHEGGYISRYCHLATISVRTGQRVKMGQKVGTVGSSGQTTAPHLHYEVKSGNGEWLDPLNCFFSELDCDGYCNFLYMGTKTEKSLD